MLTECPDAPLVLLVEDEEAHAELISRAFESSPEPYRVRTVAFLRDAGTVAASDNPAVVITDYRLPDGDGSALLAMVNGACPVIMMTSQGDEQLAVAAMKAGMQDYVVKSEAVFADMPRQAGRALREWELLRKHKRMEEEIAAREEEYRTLLENTPDFIARYDRQCRTLYANLTLLRMLEGTQADLLGKRPVELFGETAQGYEDTLKRAFATGEPDEYELSLFEPSGKQTTHLVRFVAEQTVQGEIDSVLAIGRDITERKRMEDALTLRETELRHQHDFQQTLLQGLRDAGMNLMVIENGRVVYVGNMDAAHEFGYTDEEIAAKPDFITIIHPDDRARVNEMHRRRIAGESAVPSSYETGVLMPNGERREYEISAAVIPDTDPVRVITIGRDITDRKRMERALFEREEEFRALAEHAPDPIMRYDREGRRLYMNQAGERVCGNPVAELTGGGLEKTVNDILNRTVETGEASEVELELTASSGQRLTFLVNYVPELGQDGRVASVLAVFKDISRRKQSEEIARKREQELRTLMENLPGPVIRYDLDGQRIYMNQAAEKMLGAKTDELLGRMVGDGPRPISTMIPFYRYSMDEAVKSRQTVEFEFCPDLLPDERRPCYWIRMAPDINADGQVCGVVAIGLDITEQRRMEKALYQRQQEFRVLVENAPDPISRYDVDARRIYVNPAFEQMSGIPAALLLGKRPDERAVGNSHVGELTIQALRTVLSEGLSTETEVNWQQDNGAMQYYQIRFVPEFDSGGDVTGVLSIAHNITELRNFQQQLHNLAFFDTVTGLPNRALFQDRMLQAIHSIERHDGRIAGLMLLDLDRFKSINDTMGHAAGDSLLREVGERLCRRVRSYDTVARLGGDEFVIVLQDVRHDVDLGFIARKVLSAFEEPFDIHGKMLSMTASIGIVSAPGDSLDISELMQFADSAMYHAKAQGRNNFQFYSVELTACAEERLSLEVALRDAASRLELELYYQPKVELHSGNLVGAEALLRWHHPVLGMVPPDQFVPVAEETGLIMEMGEWVLRDAFTTAAELNGCRSECLKFAVNLSVRQFEKPNLVAVIHSLLGESGCRPEWIELEITESLLLDGNSTVRAMLEELCELGFSIAIDDFGTGYSALGYLSRFPISTIKIDRSFVNDILVNRSSQELVKAIVSLADALRLDLVAEGVETAEQADYLAELGCRLVQGYFFGKPMPKSAFAAFTVTESTRV